MAPRRARVTPAEAERSIEQLYRGHRGDVYRAALRELGNVHDAEDVTQAAFVDAYRAVLGGTRPEAPRAWLLTIAENVRRRRFQTSLRRPREEPLDVDAALAADGSNEQAGVLLDALATLTTEQREAFLLREMRGLSYGEIAQRTDSTVASVQMLLFRARKALRNELEPPHVHGALVPLASLFSRFEAFSLTPRVAGAIGATALAVGVSASVPAEADPRTAEPAARQLTAVVSGPVPVTAAPAKQPPTTAKPAPVKRRSEATVPASVAFERAPRPVSAAPAPQLPPDQAQPEAQPEPASQPEPAAGSQPQPQPQPQIVAPPALLPLASPAVPSPSVPLPPPLDAVVEPVLEGAGAAGAAGASAPPLPVLPLDPLPPLLP